MTWLRVLIDIIILVAIAAYFARRWYDAEAGRRGKGSG